MRGRDPTESFRSVLDTLARVQKAARIMSSPFTSPGVAITSLSIRNYRGIQELGLDFRGPGGYPNSLVVLAGPNGCGKTAVLEAALLLIGGHKLLVGPRGKKSIRKGAAEYEIQAGVKSHNESFTVKHRSGSPPTPLPEPIPFWYFSSRRAPAIVGPVDPTVGRRGRRPAKTDENRLLNVKQRLVNAATVERFENPLPRLGRYSMLIEVINNAWRQFYPHGGGEFMVDVVRSGQSGEGSFDVYLQTAEGERIEVELLGSGQLELFLFVSELALNEDREGIVFIDEPELHLDPEWHPVIIRTLMRLQPRAQLIVATHSSEIYDAAASYERHYLVPENDPRSRLWPKRPAVVSGV